MKSHDARVFAIPRLPGRSALVVLLGLAACGGGDSGAGNGGDPAPGACIYEGVACAEPMTDCANFTKEGGTAIDACPKDTAMGYCAYGDGQYNASSGAGNLYVYNSIAVSNVREACYGEGREWHELTGTGSPGDPTGCLLQCKGGCYAVRLNCMCSTYYGYEDCTSCDQAEQRCVDGCPIMCGQSG